LPRLKGHLPPLNCRLPRLKPDLPRLNCRLPRLKPDLPRLNCRLPRLKSGWRRPGKHSAVSTRHSARETASNCWLLASGRTGPPFAQKHTTGKGLEEGPRELKSSRKTRNLDPSPSADLRVRISARGPSARYAHLEG